MESQKPQRTFRHDFGVTVCDHVFTGQSPVLLVVRDEEISWQFLCGGSLESDPCHHVGVGHLISRDSSLEIMADLAVGWYAKRNYQTDVWNFGKLDE